MRIVRGLVSAAALVATVLAVILIAVSGRSAPPPIVPGAIGSPQPPSQVAEPSAEPSVGIGLSCGNFIVDALRYNYTPAEWSKLADAVVTGTVVAIGDGQWATADGSPPRLDAGERPTAVSVYRVAEIEIAAVGKSPQSGDLVVGSAIKVRIVGGTIGCRTFSFSGQAEMKPGTAVALFLAAEPEPNLAAAPFDGFDAIEVWPISKGEAQGVSGVVSVDELLSIAASAD